MSRGVHENPGRVAGATMWWGAGFLPMAVLATGFAGSLPRGRGRSPRAGTCATTRAGLSTRQHIRIYGVTARISSAGGSEAGRTLRSPYQQPAACPLSRQRVICGRALAGLTTRRVPTRPRLGRRSSIKPRRELHWTRAISPAALADL